MLKVGTDMYWILDENNIIRRVSEWSLETNHRIVQQTEMGTHKISTVFIGIDHNFGDGKVPILFETMVFSENGEGILCHRCSTYDEAITIHNGLISKYEVMAKG